MVFQQKKDQRLPLNNVQHPDENIHDHGDTYGHLRAGHLNFESLNRGTERLRSPEGTFVVHKIFGDGNCMFRAVSFVLWATEDEHRSLRTLVVDYIVDHWRDYAAYVMAEWGIDNATAYQEYMKYEGVYASELECIVATKLYGLNLSIYRRVNASDVKRVFHNHISSNPEIVRLLFTGRSDSGHYDVLLLDDN